MKPGDAALLLGISRSTITKWTANEYRQYLSPGAQGGTGKFRVVTDQDVRILALIKALKDANTPAEEIHVALQEQRRAGWTDLPPMPEAPPAMSHVPVVPTAAADAALTAERRSLLREISTLQQRIDQLEAKLDDERADRDALLREIGDLREHIGQQENELKLWRAGRLKRDEQGE